jgi:hypothetical protein
MTRTLALPEVWIFIGRRETLLTYSEADEIVGPDIARRVEQLSLKIYSKVLPFESDSLVLPLIYFQSRQPNMLSIVELS